MEVSPTSLARTLLSHPPSDAFGTHFHAAFVDLGWRPIVLKAADGASALSLSAGGLPQVLVSPMAISDSARSVSLGYSHEAVLTLEWGAEALRVHSSASWEESPGDAPLLEIASDDVIGAAQILTAVSRHQFHALVAESSNHYRPPLPELLASTFAEFRRQVVESALFGEGPGEVAALRFFHQLLFMRFHEDRFGVPYEIRVARALQTDDLPRQIASELEWYAARFNSELFREIVDPERVPQTALKNVIRELVEPWDRLRLDFSVTTNEIAGRLYQSYLRLAPARVDEGRLFPGAEIRSRQKQQGAYYTPAAAAEFLVRETLGYWLHENRPSSFGDIRVIDPACGSGAFLVAAYRMLLEYWEQRRGRPLTPDERSQILSMSVFGVDDDAAAVMLCRVHLLEEASLGEHTLPDLSMNITQGDSLTHQGLPKDFLNRGSFDVVVTNPPFASPRLAHLKKEMPWILERFESLRGTGRNFAYAFAELALDLLKERGRAGLLVPRAILDGPSSKAAREAIGAERLQLILDFGRNVIFDYTLAYIAAIVIANEHTSRTIAARLRDDLVRKVDVLEALDQIELTADTRTTPATTVVGTFDPMDLAARDSWAPFTLRWRFELAKDIDVPTLPLGSDGAPNVVIGTQTGSDRSFVLEPSDYRVAGQRVIVQDLALPLRLAPLWIRGEDIHPFRMTPSGARVVVPCTGEDPEVDRYVERRGGVPASFRPGSLDLLRRPKLVIRNMFLEPAAAADLAGDIMLPQGVATALVPSSDSADDILFAEGLLNSSLYQWLLQGLAHPRAEGFGRLMKHHWTDVPWPRLPEDHRASVVRAAASVRDSLEREDDASLASRSRRTDTYWRARHELDMHVLDALRVKPRLRQVIGDEFWRLA